MYSDLDLAKMEVEATYMINDRGRFARRRASRCALFKTREGIFSCFRDDQPQDLIEEIEATIRHEPLSDDIRSEFAELDAYRKALTSREPIEGEARSLSYRFPETLGGGNASVVRVDDSNVGLAAECFPWLAEELFTSRPCFGVAEDGMLVSVCRSVRTSLLVLVAGVETLEAYRRRGYATAVSIEWGRAVRESGREPVYSVGFENEASHGVARKAGLVLYNADHHFK